MYHQILNNQKHLSGIKARPLFEYKGSGVLCGAFLPEEIAKSVALKIPNAEPAEDLHTTLFYFGKRDAISDATVQRISSVISDYAKDAPPLKGTIGGFGRFSANDSTGDKDVIYLSVDIANISDVRFQLKKILKANGVPITETHPFIPHITLAYIDKDQSNPFERFEPLVLELNEISVTVGTGNQNRQDFLLRGR